VTDGYNDGTLSGSGVTVEVWMTRSLFGPRDDGGEKPTEVAETTTSVLITVKAAPNPSSSYIEDSMCIVHRAVTGSPKIPARSLTAVRPRKVRDLLIKPHPGWSNTEQAKVDKYVDQPDLTGRRRTALEAPRFQGWYSYLCWEPCCRGHRQGILDWEFVTFQRNLRHLSDEDLITTLRKKFLHELFSPTREVAFYVGNQAKREQTFSVLGVYYRQRLQ